MSFVKKYFGLVLVILLSFWTIRPFFADGFFPMHDDTQVARVFEMGKALKDGMFPVRWVADLGYGYGYPIFNFYAPLSYYFGGLLVLIGLDALFATKLMMVVGILLSSVFMYLLAREFWGELGGVISGLFYVYAPYHAVDIYVRGDVGEFWAYAFIPLTFYGFYKVYKENQSNNDLNTNNSKFKNQKSKIQFKVQKFGILGALGFAGVILSHNLTALMLTPFLFLGVCILIIFSKKETRRLNTLYLIIYTLLGLILSAFYWVPALGEMKYTNVLSQIGGGADFRDHFVCINQLWDSIWGFGGSTIGCIDGLSFKIGKIHIALTLLAFVVILFLLIKKRISHLNNIYYLSILIAVLFFILGFFISIYFTLELSKPIWEGVPIMAFFQYPWRFLLLASFFSSILSGFSLWFLKEKISEIKNFNTVLYLSTGVLLFILIFFNSKLFEPQTILQKTSDSYTNDHALKWVTSKISDEYMPFAFLKPNSYNEISKDRLSILQGEAEIDYKINKTHKISAVVDVRESAKVQINIANFPAWDITINNRYDLNYKVNNTIADFVLEQGQYVIDIQFRQTPIEKMSNFVSIVGILIIIAGIILNRIRASKL